MGMTGILLFALLMLLLVAVFAYIIRPPFGSRRHLRQIDRQRIL